MSESNTAAEDYINLFYISIIIEYYSDKVVVDGTTFKFLLQIFLLTRQSIHWGRIKHEIKVISLKG
jgi:hypothetical protein